MTNILRSFGVVGLLVASSAGMVGCGGDDDDAGAGAAAGTSGTAGAAGSSGSAGASGTSGTAGEAGTAGTSGTGGDSGAAGSGAAGAGGGSPCSPGETCAAVDKTCIGWVDNSASSKPGLRMSQLGLTKPAALSQGLIGNTIGTTIEPNTATCNLMGGGTANWLFEFDEAAGTLKTGGAKPVADITTGYSFEDDVVSGLHVQPVTFENVMPDASGAFSIATGKDLVMPVYLDETATSVLLLPLRALRFTAGALSSSKNCIGKYNADTLDPGHSCVPDQSHPAFTSGASLDAHITIEEADSILVTSINQSLCVLLSGNASMYGMSGPAGATVCKRDASNNILFQGDWCDATNAAAAGGCADSVAVNGTFAASSIKIN